MSQARPQDENRPTRDKNRNGRASVANRDKPVFSSLHRQTRSQDAPRFYTDSLNTSFASHIPSPSPGRPTYGGRPRQARANNGKGLAAAYNSLGSSPGPSYGRYNTDAQDITSIASSPSRGASNRAQTLISSNLGSRARTPSPIRGRHTDPLISPISNASESSPPRGLAESYRRIQDEETLASQAEDISEGEDYFLQAPNGQLRSRLSASPDSRRSSRRFSPKLAIEKPCPDPNVDNDARKRGSRGSSPFDDDPEDDMASQHEKDQERVRSALSNTSQPFRKARGKKFTLETLRRNENGSHSGSASTGSRSISSKASDLSLNVPNGWGRKGTAGKSYLNRITEDSIGDKSKDGIPESQAESKADSIVDWMKTATETPLPEVNSDSLRPTNELSLRSNHYSPLNLNPDSVVRAISTTPQGTPPSRLRNTTIDDIRAREIKALDDFWKTDKDISEEIDVSTDCKHLPTFPPKRTLSEELDDIEEPLDDDNDDEDAVGDDAVLVLQPSIPAVSTRNPPIEHKGHSRADSRDILRTLARIESNSPSPHHREEKSTGRLESKPATSIEAPVAELSKSHPKSHSGQTSNTPAPEYTRSHMKTPMITGGWIDTPLPTVKDTKRELYEQMAKADNAKNTKTLNAPLTQSRPPGNTENASESTEGDRPFKLEDTAPKLPGSALADIIQRAKAKKMEGLNNDNDDTLQLSDSEIESLEDLLELSDNERAKLREEAAKFSVVKGGVQPERAVALKGLKAHDVPDAQIYSRLASRLTHLHSTIHDANKDVSSLQRKLSSSKHKSPKSTGLDTEYECNEGGEIHDFMMTCEKCARRERLAGNYPPKFIEWQSIQIPAPRLWTWGENAWPKFTRIGWWVLFLGTLVTLELIVADAYTPPFSAHSMRGYEFGVWYDMPRPPFVLAKLAWRNGLSYVLGPIWGFVAVAVRAVALIFGFNPGFLGNWDDLYETKTEYVFKEAVDTGGVWGQDVGIGADEYL